MEKQQHGGARPGAGRPPTHDTIRLSPEATSALRALVAADRTTGSREVVVNRLILAAWAELGEEFNTAADAAHKEIGASVEEVVARAAEGMEVWRDGEDGPYVAVAVESELPREDDAAEWTFIGYAGEELL